MKKLAIAKIKQGDILSIQSSIKLELQKLCYHNAVISTKDSLSIIGRKHISTFVSAMLSELDECEKHFTDPVSVAEFNSDRNFLNSLLKIKAS